MTSNKPSYSWLTKYWDTLRDVVSFARLCSFIDRSTGKVIPLKDHLWEWQEAFLRTLTRHRRIVVLKARQMGVSYLTMLYALWKMLTTPHAFVMCFSYREEEAIELIDKWRLIYQSLPPDIQNAFRITSPDSRTEVRLSNGSSIMAMPSTPKVGRSRTATLTILDEHAYHDYAEQNWAAVVAATANGQIISISTANGVDNFFYRLYRDAKEGTNGFHPVFLPYYLHPERDEQWYEQTRKEYDARLFNQEYPAKDTDAFLLTGDPFFDPGLLQLTASVTTPKNIDDIFANLFVLTSEKFAPFIKIYQLPIPGHRYVIGVDPISGLSRRSDNAAICILDVQTGEQVVEVAGVIPYTDLIYLIIDLHRAYPSLVVIERNGIGAAVVRGAQEAGVQLWHDGYLPKLQGKNYRSKQVRYGFPTNKHTKAMMLAMVEEGIRRGRVKLASADLIEEMRTIRRNIESQSQNLRDDRVMALAFAVIGLKTVELGVPVAATGPIEPQWTLEWWDKQRQRQFIDAGLVFDPAFFLR